MSFFDEVETTVANTRLLQAVEDNGPIVLDLKPYDDLKDFESKYLAPFISCRRLFRPVSVGNYLFKQFLLAPERKDTIGGDAVHLLNALEDYHRTYENDRRAKAELVLKDHPPLNMSVAEHPAGVREPSGAAGWPGGLTPRQQIEKLKHTHNKQTPAASVAASGLASITVGAADSAAATTVTRDAKSKNTKDEEGFGDEEEKDASLVMMPSPSNGTVEVLGGSLANPLGIIPQGATMAPLSTSMGNFLLDSKSCPPPASASSSAAASSAASALTSPPYYSSSSYRSPYPPYYPTPYPHGIQREEITVTCHPFCDELVRNSNGVLEEINFLLKNSHQSVAPPFHLFDSLYELIAATLKPQYDEFLSSPLYKKLVQLEHFATQRVNLHGFRIFRVLGRGAFGAVSAVQKLDTHAIFAMKEMGKKQVKQQSSEWIVINEKKMLSKMKSPFVLNLQYSFHNEESLYLIFDMCSGGDLKYHLKNETKAKRFDLERARFYAAEVLLGLEHIHSMDIVYRDLKPNNVLLDMSGHVKISDLGLTIKLQKNKVLKHLAGTAGYWAPEIVMKRGTYKSSDWWSFGVFLYEMLSGRRPNCSCGKKSTEWCPFGQKRSMEENALKEDGILKLDISYPAEEFPEAARDLLEKLFIIDPKARLGARGVEEIKAHAFFRGMDWQKLSALEIHPPFIPDGRTVNANSIGEVGEFNKGKFKKTKLTDEDEKLYEGFSYGSEDGVQAELVMALQRIDLPPEKGGQDPQAAANKAEGSGTCCNAM